MDLKASRQQKRSYLLSVSDLVNLMNYAESIIVDCEGEHYEGGCPDNIVEDKQLLLYMPQGLSYLQSFDSGMVDVNVLNAQTMIATGNNFQIKIFK